MSYVRLSELIQEQKIAISLSIIILLGLVLRVFQVGFQCLWTEELYTLSMSQLGFVEICISSISTDFNPPLFYLLAATAHSLFHTAVSIRYPSVLFGTLLIPMMYWLGSLYKDQITGLYAAGTTAVLYPLVYYSQFGRAYEVCIFWFALTLIFYLKIKSQKLEVNLNAIPFWLCAVAAIYSHLFVGVPIVILLIDLIFSDNHRNGAIVSTLLIVLSLPIAVTMRALFSTRLTTVHMANSGTAYGYGMSLVEMLYNTPTELFDFCFPLFLVLIPLAYWYNRRQDRFFVALSGLTILFGLACATITAFFPRYYLVVVIPMILVSSATLTDCIERKVTSPALALCAWTGFLLLVQSPDFIYHYFTQQYIC